VPFDNSTETVPAKTAAAVLPREGVTARFCERALRDAGVPQALAKSIVSKGWRSACKDQIDGNQLDRSEDHGRAAIDAAIRLLQTFKES
jgi:hypothetical protein